MKFLSIEWMKKLLSFSLIINLSTTSSITYRHYKNFSARIISKSNFVAAEKHILTTTCCWNIIAWMFPRASIDSSLSIIMVILREVHTIKQGNSICYIYYISEILFDKKGNIMWYITTCISKQVKFILWHMISSYDWYLF